MNIVFFLIAFPLVVAAALLVLPRKGIGTFIVRAGAFVVAAVSLALLGLPIGSTLRYFDLPTAVSLHFVDLVMLVADIVIAGYIVYMGVRFRKFLVCGLSIAQLALIVWFEIANGSSVEAAPSFFIDTFSVIMALIVGVVGSLILIFATGYMESFHSHFHKKLKDQRRIFFPVLYIFLSAMFGIIFSNKLVWMCFFWEVTTLCSFLLIRYKKTAEANNSSFRALTMNLWGGLAFAAGIIYLYSVLGISTLDALLQCKQQGIVIGAALLAFAGLTKSAQLPFSRWLTGAMVAPTPVSALLHSSTMVKAGVYLILRLAVPLQGTIAGFVVALIGGVTFLVTSLVAISQSDAKKVLAYSTIANLGLIVLCAGVGTYEAIWAGLLLIIFHAVAKCLLFLCVGEVEHKISSRNIEAMEGLIVTMPKLSIMMQVGIAGMFLAPFGMLISKWAVLKALVDYNPLLVVFIVFGSAATVFFWVKWLGKLIIVSQAQREIEDHISAWEWGPLALLSALTITLCGFFPLVSSHFVEPYVIEIFGKTFTMSAGNIHIMSIMLAMVMLFPLTFLNYGKKVKVIDAYLGGVNADSPTEFYGFCNEIKRIEMKNYYLEHYWGEAKLMRMGIILCFVLTVIMFGAAWL
jgi:ech hydrogenase subunit A